jgi:hypothetical protein
VRLVVGDRGQVTVTPTAGVPRTKARPPATSMSSGAASSRCAAIAANLSLSTDAVAATAPAIIDPLRLPPVPAPYGVNAVSPWTAWMWSIGTPSASAVSWTAAVSRLLPVDPPAT